MPVYPPWSRALLGTAVVGSVAVIATSLARGLITNIFGREPLLVKLVPEKIQMPPGEPWLEESEPELLQDAPWPLQPAAEQQDAAGTHWPQPLAHPLPTRRYRRQDQIWCAFAYPGVSHLDLPGT
jgi:hypothetical protein